MEPTLAELGLKLDALTAQVAYLAEQAQLAERAREERNELINDAMPIAKDALRLASEQLQEVQDYLAPQDLLRLVKKLARHAPQIEALLDQLNSVTDLMEIAGPIAKEGMNKATALLTEAERKGYFAAAQGGLRIADNLVTSFAEAGQPVDTSLLGLLRQLGDPDVRRGLALSMRMLRVIGAQAK